MPSRVRHRRVAVAYPSRTPLLVLLLHLLLPFPGLASAPPNPAPFLPIIVHTWSGTFTAAASAAFEVLGHAHGSVLDAIQAGGSACEHNQCDGTVGYGGSPDEKCETTLDAMIMDGNTMDVGAVGALRRVKHAMAVARHVLEYTEHTLLVGELATQFAMESGFAQESLTTDASAASCHEWKLRSCQPNARRAGAVTPDPRKFCGPYRPTAPGNHADVPSQAQPAQRQQRQQQQASTGHDTISLIALDANGNMAAGTTTNGQAHKVPGRVGDGPVAGSGSYVDSQVGGCGATGDGDIMMRFLPCYQAVESMRRGMSPAAAAEDAVARMLARYPRVRAGVVVLGNSGEHAAAASNWSFSYSVRGADMNETRVVVVEPMRGRGDVPGILSEL